MRIARGLRRFDIGMLQGLLGVRGTPVNIGGTAGTAAVCQLCAKVCDTEEILDCYPSQYARVLVTHHGSEEVQRFDMGSSNWDGPVDWHRSLDSYLANAKWFVPETMSENQMRGGFSVPTHEPEADGTTVYGGIIGPDGNPVKADAP